MDVNFGSKKREIKSKIYYYDSAKKIFRVNPGSRRRLSASTNKGFTLTELLVVIAIIGILSTIVVFNYRPGGEQLKLQRSAYKLAQEIRGVCEMAMSTKEIINEGIPTVYPRYGIAFDLGNAHIFIFGDENDNGTYQPSDKNIKSITLEENVMINALYVNNSSPPPDFETSSQLFITFKPPNPTIEIRNPSTGGYSVGKIELSVAGETKTIRINSVGLVEIE